ncbi:MAG: vitamin B12-dependent ribonucleotide reductase [Proteobacteria bacterium]|nr:vitamin B12-dependent ribonucleotide reductase [Pseudomonadota bacterium]NIS69077.1 vitamin B12-dependent ribonucleotide reductase [Pseudomonadota bacterium]
MPKSDLRAKESESGAKRSEQVPKGVTIRRYFTKKGVSPFDMVEWERRSATIVNESGEKVFEQDDLEFPSFWSQMAVNVVASKYFRGIQGRPERESSLRQLIGRVVDTITRWGTTQGYFISADDRGAFHDELTYLILYQMASFNSPVWFNCGIEEKPQCSACFINSVEDSMASILELAKIEGMLFKHGSGTGTNLSPLRSSKEHLSGGGTASGPVSFMKGYDAFAGVIKSGGKTRRAAKMVILNVDHPDIIEFINCKTEEEKKVWALIDSGYDGSFNGEAYGSVFFQNANHSVRVPDEFMKAVLDDATWQTRFVTTGEVMETYQAREVLLLIAEGTHVSGDPGMQFDTTINRWHTCSNSGRINASNPCSEYMFLDDSACNLASLNLLRFLNGEGEFDVPAFRHAVEIMILAQEIIVDNAGYPTEPIATNSHMFRALGLGYANLGALLMARGLPYDSDSGRNYAAAITALMTGQAYLTSAKVAGAMGSFEGFDSNRKPMLEVMRKHYRAISKINSAYAPLELLGAVHEVWERAIEEGEGHGYRNAQVTVLAPTGTIAFMMDCDTTGIEPDISLIKYKKLVGGGILKIVNNTVSRALDRLGYSEKEREEILQFLDKKETIEGSPHLKEADLPVFDCAFKPIHGNRSIHYMGHITMMGVVQPFISGAISKTINVPNETTVDEIAEAYIQAWQLGLKAVAIYRDGSKRTQPLSQKQQEDLKVKGSPYRRRLPDERKSLTHKFSIGNHEGYITVGMYDDGTPGEIFVVIAKEGSVVSGLMDSFATAVSLTLQYGVPLKILVNKFAHARFEPSGFTKNPQIPIAKSLSDYIFRWLASKFLTKEEQAEVGVLIESASEGLHSDTEGGGGAGLSYAAQEDAPPCPDCGSIMVRNGSCYKCLNCGATSGCS